METIAQRIERLRTEKGIGRQELTKALGFPKLTIEKFETGRLTPSNAQKEKLAAYFGVSVGVLTGEEDDTMAQWLADGPQEEPELYVPRKPKPKPDKTPKPNADGNTLFASLLTSDAFKQAVLDVLKSPEGRELLRKYGGR